MNWIIIYSLMLCYCLLPIPSFSQVITTGYQPSEIRLTHLRPEIPKQNYELPKGKTQNIRLTWRAQKAYKNRKKELLSRRSNNNKIGNCEFNLSQKKHYPRLASQSKSRLKGGRRFCDICNKKH